MDQEELNEDLSLFISLFYDFVFEDYFEVIEKSLTSSTHVILKEEPTKKTTKKNKADSKIDPELHKKLLAAKAAHNEKVGKEAEEFVFQIKRQNLLDLITLNM